MNLYFLVEGKTERIVYPKWLSSLLPHYQRVNIAEQAVSNNYYLISGGGYPSLLDNHLADSIAEINDINAYDYLIVVLDCDDRSTKETILEVESFIVEKKLSLRDSCQLKIIPQLKAFESWCLGNRRAYPRTNTSADFNHFSLFYNVYSHDPENMMKPQNSDASIGDYHEAYLKQMLREKNTVYTKANPTPVCEPSYLDQLIKRSKETEHLASFKTFLDFCHHISTQTVISVNP